MESKRAYGSRLVTEAKTLSVDYRMELDGGRFHTQLRRCAAATTAPRRTAVGRRLAARFRDPAAVEREQERRGGEELVDRVDQELADLIVQEPAVPAEGSYRR
jgi:hypothetical protein